MWACVCGRGGGEVSYMYRQQCGPVCGRGEVSSRAYKIREGTQLGKHQNSNIGGRMCMNAHVIDFY